MSIFVKASVLCSKCTSVNILRINHCTIITWSQTCIILSVLVSVFLSDDNIIGLGENASVTMWFNRATRIHIFGEFVP